MKRITPNLKSGISAAPDRPVAAGRFCAWSCGLGALLLAGCAVGPDYQRPTDHNLSPAAFRGDASVATNSLGDLPWRQVFQDPTLQTLIGTALTNNYDLRIAVTRVEQARATAAQARGQFYPQLNYGVDAGAGKNIGAGNAPSPTGKYGSVFAADVTASWSWTFGAGCAG